MKEGGRQEPAVSGWHASKDPWGGNAAAPASGGEPEVTAQEKEGYERGKQVIPRQIRQISARMA